MTYPDTPGWKEEHTSRIAALRISKNARTIREKVLLVLEDSDVALSPEQIADRLSTIWRRAFTVYQIRPRLTELKEQGKAHKVDQITGDLGTDVWTWAAGHADEGPDCDDGDDGYALASAGFGTDEDYG